MTQLRIAETEKYAHVTFFFNGGVEKARIRARIALWFRLPKVATLRPSAGDERAYAVTDASASSAS